MPTQPRTALVSMPVDAGQEAPQWQQINLAAIVALLRRRKWTIIATVACVAVAALLVTSQLAKRYTASALVVVDSRDSQLLGFQPGINADPGVTSLVDTEVAIARSNDVLARVASDLDLANTPDFDEGQPIVDVLRTLVGLGKTQNYGPAKQYVDLEPAQQAKIIERLAEVTSVDRLGLTSVISMSATASTPELSAEMANGLADGYLAEQIEAKLNSNERATRFLNEHVDSLAGIISDKETQIDDFVTKKLAELGSPEAKALLARIADERKQRDAASAAISRVRDALNAQDFGRLAELVDVEASGIAAQRRALVRQIAETTDQTALVSANARLTELDSRIRDLANRQANTLAAQITASNDRSATLRSQVASVVAAMAVPKEITNQLAAMQRELETNRALYDSFLTKLRQVAQQSDFNIPDSRIIASASPPTEASFPPTALILIGSVFVALLGGFGLAFLREHFIGGVTSVEQLENLAGVPVIAGVPQYLSKTSERPDLAIIADPLSMIAEALRRLQVGIDAFVPQDKRVILVTSSVPAEGKTTIALGLARQMVAAGNRTLFIDADLRHPTAHRYVGHQTDEGLIDFLTRRSENGLDQVSVVREEASGVDFVLGKEGSTIATDALLMSKRFEELMEFARDHYDLVIVDTPPAGLVVDAAIVARHCDMGIFVTRYASTGQHQVRSALRDLYRTNLPLYCVLNQIQKAESYRYGGYSGKYSHYYGLKSG